MTDENKQLAKFKITKEELLIVAIISLVILIFYFTLTVANTSVFKSLEGTLLCKENINKWWNLLWLLTGITLLSLLYLVVTNRLYRVCRRFINSNNPFIFKATQYKNRIKIIIILSIVIALFIVTIGLYYNCCDWWIILSARLSAPQEPLNLRNVLIGFAGIATLIFAGWRTHIADQQKDSQVKRTEIEFDRRLSERFDGAIDALSKILDDGSFPAHLGAISSLRTLAIDSPKNTQRCLDIICSCNQWMEGYIENFVKERSKGIYSSRLLKEDDRIGNKYKTGGITLLHEKRSQQALVAVSHILEKISTDNPQQIKALKFYNKMLCGISLNKIKLDNIDFNNVYLVAASLYGTYLKQAKLNSANLQGASLWGVNLNGANLEGANLDGASIEGAHLEDTCLANTNLRGASLVRANLEGGVLLSTHLDGASLVNTYLSGASLVNTNLRGASLVDTHLDGALLIDARLQGATMDNVDLSNSILLSCNLYGVILKDINSENIVFNDIPDIVGITSKKERKKFLDDICQHIAADKVKSFKQRMESAWRETDDLQEPDGLDVIRNNSITPLNKKGEYDISEEKLDSLEKKWQTMLDEKGIEFLYNMKHSISSIGENRSSFYKWVEMPKGGISADKNTTLIIKLQKRIDELIKSNKK